MISLLVAGFLEKDGEQCLDPVARRKLASRICDKTYNILNCRIPLATLPFSTAEYSRNAICSTL